MSGANNSSSELSTPPVKSKRGHKPCNDPTTVDGAEVISKDGTVLPVVIATAENSEGTKGGYREQCRDRTQNITQDETVPAIVIPPVGEQCEGEGNASARGEGPSSSRACASEEKLNRRRNKCTSASVLLGLVKSRVKALKKSKGVVAVQSKVDVKSEVIEDTEEEEGKDDYEDVMGCGFSDAMSEAVSASSSAATLASETCERCSSSTGAIDPDWLKPFDYGWRRQIVHRTTAVNDGSHAADVYYFAPDNTKLRSLPQILSYLIRTSNTTLSSECFSLRRARIYHEPQETIRVATWSRGRGSGADTDKGLPSQSGVKRKGNGAGMPSAKKKKLNSLKGKMASTAEDSVIADLLELNRVLAEEAENVIQSATQIMNTSGSAIDLEIPLNQLGVKSECDESKSPLVLTCRKSWPKGEVKKKVTGKSEVLLTSGSSSHSTRRSSFLAQTTSTEFPAISGGMTSRRSSHTEDPEKSASPAVIASPATKSKRGRRSKNSVQVEILSPESNAIKSAEIATTIPQVTTKKKSVCDATRSDSTKHASHEHESTSVMVSNKGLGAALDATLIPCDSNLTELKLDGLPENSSILEATGASTIEARPILSSSAVIAAATGKSGADKREMVRAAASQALKAYMSRALHSPAASVANTSTAFDAVASLAAFTSDVSETEITDQAAVSTGLAAASTGLQAAIETAIAGPVAVSSSVPPEPAAAAPQTCGAPSCDSLSSVEVIDVDSRPSRKRKRKEFADEIVTHAVRNAAKGESTKSTAAATSPRRSSMVSPTAEESTGKAAGSDVKSVSAKLATTQTKNVPGFKMVKLTQRQLIVKLPAMKTGKLSSGIQSKKNVSPVANISRKKDVTQKNVSEQIVVGPKVNQIDIKSKSSPPAKGGARKFVTPKLVEGQVIIGPKSVESKAKISPPTGTAVTKIVPVKSTGSKAAAKTPAATSSMTITGVVSISPVTPTMTKKRISWADGQGSGPVSIDKLSISGGGGGGGSIGSGVVQSKGGSLPLSRSSLVVPIKTAASRATAETSYSLNSYAAPSSSSDSAVHSVPSSTDTTSEMPAAASTTTNTSTSRITKISSKVSVGKFISDSSGGDVPVNEQQTKQLSSGETVAVTKLDKTDRYELSVSTAVGKKKPTAVKEMVEVANAKSTTEKEMVEPTIKSTSTVKDTLAAKKRDAEKISPDVTIISDTDSTNDVEKAPTLKKKKKKKKKKISEPIIPFLSEHLTSSNVLVLPPALVRRIDDSIPCYLSVSDKQILVAREQFQCTSAGYRVSLPAGSLPQEFLCGPETPLQFTLKVSMAEDGGSVTIVMVKIYGEC